MLLLRVELHPALPSWRTVPFVEGPRNRVSEDRQLALLVVEPLDYAIFLLDRTAASRAGTPAPSGSRATRADEIIGRHFSRLLHRGGPSRGTSRPRSCELRDPRRPLRGGGLARPQGRHALLGQRRRSPRPRRDGRSLGLRQGHARPHRAPAARGADARQDARARGRQRRARRVPPPGARASATTRSSCSTPPAASPPGTPAPSASRATRPDEIIGRHFSIFYTDEDRARDHPAHELAIAVARGPLRGGGLARPQGRHAASGPTSSITAMRDDDGRLTGLRQGHARPDRAAGGRAGAARRVERAAARQRGARPLRRGRRARPDRPAADDLGVRRAAGARDSQPAEQEYAAAHPRQQPSRLTRHAPGPADATPAPGSAAGRARAGRPAADAVDDVLADLAALDRRARRSVTVALPADARCAPTPADVRVVLQNLLSNAVKFSDAGTPGCASRPSGRRRLARHGRGQRAGHRAGRAGAIFGAFERGDAAAGRTATASGWRSASG